MLNRKLLSLHAPARQMRGFSLMEVLIGLTIGVVCALAIFQALSVWTARSRTTAAGSDAQVAGTLAMYYLDRDFKLAGMGFGTATTEFAGCQIATSDATFLPAPRLAAVDIIQGAGGAADTLRVLYGTSEYMVVGQPFEATTDTSKQTRARAGFNPGDRFIAAGRSTAGTVSCALLTMTRFATPDDGKTILHEAGYGPFTDFYGTPSRFTHTTNVTTGWTGYTGRLFNLGPTPVLAEWTVAGNTLRRVNRLVTQADGSLVPTADLTQQVVASGVVNLQAQYGLGDANGRIGDGDWLDTLPVGTDWTRVRAIRFGLLVRSDHYDPSDEMASTVNATSPSWAGGNFTMVNVDGSTGSTANKANDWRYYRYRVYETVVPLRNMIWGNSAPL
ncbi:MAG: PilW family protein [Burkholderiales bacterium]|nr:PilW family protein [Burkholderiales bacterium]